MPDSPAPSPSSPDRLSGHADNGYVEIAADGSLRIPADLARAMGFTPGSRAKVRQHGERLVVQRPVTGLARLYVEPTTACNLRCRTCIRNVWEEPIGQMSTETFARILAGIRTLPDLPTIVLGGLGEPFVHPDLLDMIRELKRATARVEVITNAALLDETRSRALVDLGLDMLWVSLDGASPDCYAGVRVEGDLSLVMANLKRLQDVKRREWSARPRIGIAFVAMKRNVTELPDVLKLEYRIGAREFVVTHVYPHTPELLDQALYRRSIGDRLRGRSHIQLARPELGKESAWMLEGMIRGDFGPRLADLELLWPVDTCPFVLRGSTCIRWDGAVSPCLPLLHRHTSYLQTS